MPGGPEVKILVENLNKKIKGKKISNILFTGGRYKKHSLPKNYKKISDIFPIKIKEVKSKGKFIYIILENDYTIWITLGMTGFFTYENLKHNDVTFIINNKELYFNDYRHFATITFCLSNECLLKKLKQLGPDIYSSEFTLSKLTEIIRKTKKTMIIASFIMNQKKISGVGNYMRSEIFYDSKLNPFLQLGKLSDNYIKKLYNSIVKIARLSYLSQTNELINEKNYTDNFEFKVYQQEFSPNNEKVLRKVINGRSIFYVKSQTK